MNKLNHIKKKLDVIDNISKVSYSELVEKILDIIVKEFELNGGILLLVKNNHVYVEKITSNKASKKFISILNVPINKLKISLDSKSENFIVKCINNKEIIVSNDLYNFTKGVLNHTITKYATKITKTKISMCFPIIHGEKVLGALYLANDKKFNSFEIMFLKLVANLIGIALINARTFVHKELAIKDLEEALRKEKDMMDILGHELRTPLSTSRNAILLIDTLVNNSQDGSIKIDMIRKYVDIAKENIRREVRLLETVLSSTRIENGKMQIIYAEVEANDVVGDSITSFQEKAEQKGLKLKMKVPKHKVYVKVGREQIQEVIDNLVSNAVKYTEKGEIEVSLEENEDKVIFAVKDTGIGVPKEEIKNLGKKFHRVDMYVDSSEERNGEVKIVRPGGTGIGLYVSFELVKMMGGKVEIESEVAKGSTFKVIFPKFSK
jgi:signal transduction histidine kinase